MRGPAAVQPCHRSFAACSPAMSSGLRQRGGIAPAAPDDRRDGIARSSAGWRGRRRPGSTPIRRKANRSTPLVACIETTQRRPRLRADGSIGGWLASRESGARGWRRASTKAATARQQPGFENPRGRSFVFRRLMMSLRTSAPESTFEAFDEPSACDGYPCDMHNTLLLIAPRCRRAMAGGLGSVDAAEVYAASKVTQVASGRCRILGRLGPAGPGWTRTLDRTRVHTRQVERERTPRFVGRHDEIELLTRLLDEASAGRPSLLLVGGDAGVGKTRLLTEFCAEANAMTLRGGCLPLGERGLPFAPLAEILRQLVTERSMPTPIPAVFGRLIPGLAVDTPGAPPTRSNLFQAVLDLFGRLSEETDGHPRPGRPALVGRLDARDARVPGSQPARTADPHRCDVPVPTISLVSIRSGLCSPSCGETWSSRRWTWRPSPPTRWPNIWKR